MPMVFRWSCMERVARWRRKPASALLIFNPTMQSITQIPAHNTVVVDGISTYHEMRSNHGFTLKKLLSGLRCKNGYLFPL